MTNERAQAWLQSLGFKTEPEPAWIMSGERPDFFVTGPTAMWVEVKTLEWNDALGNALYDLRKRCEKLPNPGPGSLHAIVARYDGRAGKVALRHALAASRKSADDTVRIIMVPGDPAYGTNVSIEYEAETGEHVHQTGPASVSGVFQCYPALEPKNWSETSTIHFSNGSTVSAPLYRLFGSRTPFLLAMRLFPSAGTLSVGSGGSGVRQNTSRTTIRDGIKEANSQIRNGQQFAAVPGLVTIYHDSMDAYGVEMFMTALFGDLTFPVSGKPPRLGEPLFGPNAVLTATKNRGISAIRYHPYKDEPITVVNPYADSPIEWRTFADSAWILDGERFVLVGR